MISIVTSAMGGASHPRIKMETTAFSPSLLARRRSHPPALARPCAASLGVENGASFSFDSCRQGIHYPRRPSPNLSLLNLRNCFSGNCPRLNYSSDQANT